MQYQKVIGLSAFQSWFQIENQSIFYQVMAMFTEMVEVLHKNGVFQLKPMMESSFSALSHTKKGGVCAYKSMCANWDEYDSVFTSGKLAM